MKTLAAAALCLLALAGCSPPEPRVADSTTQRQRDSAVANSGLPGATGVGRAMNVQDSSAARTRMIDSASTAP